MVDAELHGRELKRTTITELGQGRRGLPLNRLRDFDAWRVLEVTPFRAVRLPGSTRRQAVTPWVLSFARTRSSEHKERRRRRSDEEGRPAARVRVGTVRSRPENAVPAR
jgi:hypothetical protein